ncbi:unnamed protein product [Candida verbasci]|uniref:Pheromone alpha factor receptor n=1 Tax=Candida verbasci TaxID=1227364 RepID=A0A9W4TRJ2_9ASCO|nr:unnamed protein product [Candida verbasci]
MSSAVIYDSGDVLVNYTIPGIGENVSLPFKEIDEFLRDELNLAIISGVSIGACSLLFILLLGILKNNYTKLKKSWLYHLNILICLVNVLRASCFINYLLSELASVSFTFTGVYNMASFANAEAANWFMLILYILIQMSLTFQIYIMFNTPNLKRWGYLVTALSILLALTSCTFQLYSVITQHLRYESTKKHLPQTYVQNILNDLQIILFTANICVMSLLLIFKLILAIRTRRYLGLKQFDSFHILLIMSTQTFIIPSVLLIVHFVKKDQNSTYVNFCFLLIILTLPLTSLWSQTENSIKHIKQAPSISFLSRESSNKSQQETLKNFGIVSSKFNSNISSQTSPSTLKDDDCSLVLEKSIESINSNNSGLTASLPKDIENLLSDNDDNIVSRQVTMLKTETRSVV